MDETTKRDLNPPDFTGGGWPKEPAAAPFPGDAPTRPTANAAAYDRPTGTERPVPWPTRVGGSPSQPPESSLPEVPSRQFAPSDPRTSDNGRPLERPSSATGSRVIATGEIPVDAGGLTYASKLPADHPGLQLDKPKARTLRKGPILTSVGILSAFVGVALVVALSPKSDPAKAASPTPAEAPGKDIALPDSVRDAPDNNSALHPAPRLGPPLHGGQPTPASDGNDVASGQALRQSLREERAKVLSSPILVEIESPTLPDQGGQLAPHGSAPANVLGAASSDGTPAASGSPPSAPSLAAAIADPNMQQHKSDFLSRDGVNNASYLSGSIVTPRSPYEVKAGTVIPTSLITGLDSDLPGQIVGQVRENVYDTVSGTYLLIPQGSRLLATYDSSVTFGQSRVLVCWNRLIRPDGISIALECMPGVDLTGYAGFSDEVDNHWWRIITGVALGTLVSATAQRSQGDVSGYSPTIPQLWASNAGGALNQAGQAITQKNLAIQPTIKIRPGFSVNVLVTKDIVLVPYNR